MIVENSKRIAEELRIVPEIADLPEDVLLWLANKVKEVTHRAGEIIVNEGEPADTFVILLEGDLQLRRESDFYL